MPNVSDIKEFEELLAQSFDVSSAGEIVNGTVVKIANDYVVIDIGYKSEGHIPLSEFKDKEGNINVKVGDEVEVLLLSTDSESGEILVSKEN